MNIIVDAFGGDNAPLEIIKGCVEAVAEYNINVTLTGDETKIKNVFSENSLSMNNIDICHCTQKITMEDSAESVLKEKKDSSMAVGLRLLNEGKGDAFVSAGNSGALCVGATLAIKRIKGIKRPAFAPVMPSESGFFMLMDGGANVECRPEMLYQFAVMGSIYMERLWVSKPPCRTCQCRCRRTQGNRTLQKYARTSSEQQIEFHRKCRRQGYSERSV